MLDIKIQKTSEPKPIPKKGEPLGFGHIFTDHMFIMNYTEGKGWHDPRIVPFGDITLSPAAMVLHSDIPIEQILKNPEIMVCQMA